MMTVFNTIARSIIVTFAIVLVIISVNFEKYVSEPDFETIENPVERLFEITRTDTKVQEDAEIFQRKSFAYLADDNQTADNSQLNSLRPMNDTANRLVVAKNLARQENYKKALKILGNVQPIDAQSYDVRIMRAQINSSAGNYDMAETLLRNLRAEFPHDPDLMVAYGHLYLGLGQLADAEDMFSKILVDYPGYSGAKAGMAKLREARRQ